MILFLSHFSIHCSPFSVVAALAPHAHKLAKRRSVILLTKPRSSKARQQHQFQKGKELSRWSQCDIRKARLCSLHKKRRKPMSNARRTAHPGASTWNEHLDTKSRAAKSVVFIKTQRVAKSPCPSIGRPIAVYFKDDGDMRNLLSPGVELTPNMLTEVKDINLKTFGKIRFHELSINTATWCIFACDFMSSSII